MTAGLPKRQEWPAPWLKGEVLRHCMRCEAVVERNERACHRCGAPLLRECPQCHYWSPRDASYCVSCRHAFPLPLLPRGVVKLWHPTSTEAVEPQGVGDDP
jgi:predicted amidophosphoribosyltransferase